MLQNKNIPNCCNAVFNIFNKDVNNCLSTRCLTITLSWQSLTTIFNFIFLTNFLCSIFLFFTLCSISTPCVFLKVKWNIIIKWLTSNWSHFILSKGFYRRQQVWIKPQACDPYIPSSKPAGAFVVYLLNWIFWYWGLGWSDFWFGGGLYQYQYQTSQTKILRVFKALKLF